MPPSPLEQQVGAIEVVRAARPDLVVLTGDFVAHSQAYLDDLTELLGMLDVPAFAVLGNHDHWCGADAVARAITKQQQRR